MKNNNTLKQSYDKACQVTTDTPTATTQAAGEAQENEINSHNI